MSTAAFHESQRKLDLVKRNAHDILGVKREQVHRVVESLSRPGQYDITVHRDGRVEYHTWTVPAIEDVLASFDAVEAYESHPETPSAATEPEEPVEESPVISDENNADENLIHEDEPLAEGQVVVPSAPESPAAANPAPRRRGRPSKS
jgi:hypothetical protein